MKKQKLALVVVLLLLCVGLAFSLTSCGEDENIYTKDDVNSLIAELEAALTEKATENEAAITALKAEYTAKVAELEKANSDNENAIATLNASYTAKVAELEAADKSNADALAKLKAEYEADLAELQKPSGDNSTAIENLISTYESKLAELEAANKANTDALTALKTEYEADLTELQKADAENKAAIESLTSTYEGKVAELEASDKANTDALAALRTEYEADLTELQKADAENKAAIESLTSTYENKVAELEANDKANADALAALRAEYESDLAELQKVDNENAAAIESLTSTYESKVAELEANDKANADSLAALRTEYEADLAELQNADSENKAAIESLTSTYEGKVAELEASDKANADALAALRTEYEADLAQLQNADSENKAAIESLTSTYESKVAELETADKANADALAELKADYESDIAELQKADSENKAAIESLTSTYESKVAELEKADKANADALAALRTEYEAELAELQNADSENAAAIESLTSTYEGKVADLEVADKAIADSLAALTSEHNASVAEIEADILANTEAINAYKNELQGKIDDLTAKYDAKVASIEEMITSLNAIDANNSSRIAELESQISQLLTVKTYTVTFDSNGGTAVESITVEENKKIPRPENPTREGYTFDGWYSGYNNEEKWMFTGFTVTEDITLTAKWIPNTYEITFDSLNGAPCEKYIATYDSEYDLPESTKDGYAFSEWLLNGEIFSSKGIWTLTENISLVAKWVDEKYTVSFDSKGAELLENQVINYRETYALPIPYIAGSEFLGWHYSDALIPSEGVWEYEEDMALVAKWQRIEYHINFNTSTTDVNVSPISLYYGDSYILPIPNRTNYNFVGWTLNGEWLNDGVYNYTADITLIAQWEGATDSFYFIENEDTVVITEFKGRSQYVNVPSTINGKSVTINADVFAGNTNIKSLSFDGSFLGFIEKMFAGCTSLEKLTISSAYDKELYWLFGDSIDDVPETLKTIEYAQNSPSINTTMWMNAPANHDIKLITASDKTTYEENTFKNCLGLTEICFAYGTSTLSKKAISYCDNLKIVRIPSSVLSAPDTAIYGCSNIEILEIPGWGGDYEEFFGKMFYNSIEYCKSAEYPYDLPGDDAGYIEIPKYIGNVGYDDRGAYRLRMYVEYYYDRTFRNYEKRYYWCYYDIPTTLSTIIVNGESIEANAFAQCYFITDVIILPTVKTIKSGAFYECDATRYYYSENEPTLNADGTAYDGNYWYYDENGKIVIWSVEE